MSKLFVALSLSLIFNFSNSGYASEPTPTPQAGEYAPTHQFSQACLSGQDVESRGFTLGLYVNQGILDTSASRLDAQTIILSGSPGYMHLPGNFSRTINGYASIALQIQPLAPKDKTQNFMGISGSGALWLGPTILQDLIQKNGSSICFSIAMIQTLYSGTTLYGGYVTLGLSNGQFYPILF